MIYWSKRGQDADKVRYTQLNNASEEMFRKLNVKGHLESCGPTAAVMCTEAVGIETKNEMGVQPEDLLMIYMNNPNNYSDLEKDRVDYGGPPLRAKDYMMNRVPQAYPRAVENVLGVEGDYLSSGIITNIPYNLKNERAVQICFRKPGHYVAVIGYDVDTEEIIYNDPLGKWNVRLSVHDAHSLFHGWGIVYYPEA